MNLMHTANSLDIVSEWDVQAFLTGVEDGKEQGFELSSGMSYEDLSRQWAYDTGTYIGACLRVR